LPIANETHAGVKLEIGNRKLEMKDAPIYALAAVLGICAGVLDVKVGDLLLTALFVLASTMLLGVLRPDRPWRWILIVAVFVPLLQLLAYWFLTEKPYRAQIYESFLGFLTGMAGAYGGSAGRRAVDEILKGK
jgi:cell division protein FtsW (lipid II flippase)